MDVDGIREFLEGGIGFTLGLGNARKLMAAHDAALGRFKEAEERNEAGAQQIDELQDLVIALRDQVIELGGRPTTEYTHIEAAHALLESAEKERDAALERVGLLREALADIAEMTAVLYDDDFLIQSAKFYADESKEGGAWWTRSY